MTTANINTGVNSLSELVNRLKAELQEYHNNAAKGGANRRRNMVLLAWDIRRIERKQNTVNA